MTQAAEFRWKNDVLLNKIKGLPGIFAAIKFLFSRRWAPIPAPTPRVEWCNAVISRWFRTNPNKMGISRLSHAGAERPER
jgi:hypothetical protein